MDPGEEPRVLRGRPRTPGADDKILAAALAEYGERGWAGFTMDGVARRAGVGKSTIYLRWSDKDSLLTDAVGQAGLELTGIDTGSLRGDLEQLALNLMRHFHTPAGWAAVRVIFDAASVQQRLGDFAEAVTEVHAQEVERICQRATARGEMVEGFPPGAVAETLYGSAILNALSERLEQRQDADDEIRTRAAHVVDLVLDGVAAGAAQPR